ncbi:MAG: hypothetical protein ABSF64_05670 [Bryobacteraceae bacterium]|jgi:uncharacterized protein (TIGR03437 family)
MHKRFARLLAVSLLSIVAALAQPVINVAISSAVARGPGLPGSGIAQGSIFSVFGTGLGPAALAQANSFPLPTNLAGTSLSVTVGSTQVSAIVLVAASYQINAILPSATPVGSGTFTVTYNGQTSAPADIQVVGSTFGIYTFSEQGSGQAIATDVSYNLNTIVHTFHPGDYVILWGTGLGAINGSDAQLPPVGNLPTSVKVYVGNTTASIDYQGRSGCCAGLDQIVFQVPTGVTGCYVPVAVETGGVPGNIGNFTTIAVSDSGQTCSDSLMGQDLVNQLAAGQTVDFGLIRLESWIAKYIPGTAGNANEDFGYASFSEFTPATAGLAQYGVSSGYCAAVDCSYGCGGTVMDYTANLTDSSPAQLDAGAALSVVGAPPASLPQEQGTGFYYAFLSGSGRYLWSDLTFPVTGTGGAVVGAFSVNDVTSTPTAALTGITNSQTISRSGDLTLQWTGGDPTLQNGQITIYAQAYNSTQFEFLQCTAPVTAQQFTIPAWVVAALPISGTGTITGTSFTYPQGWIQVGQYNKPTAFTAPGLTAGIVTDIFYNGIGVYFQ